MRSKICLLGVVAILAWYGWRSVELQLCFVGRCDIPSTVKVYNKVGDNEVLIDSFKVNLDSAKTFQTVTLGTTCPSSLALVCTRKEAPLVVDDIFLRTSGGFTVWRWQGPGEESPPEAKYTQMALTLIPWQVRGLQMTFSLLFVFAISGVWVWIMLAEEDGRLRWSAVGDMFRECFKCISLHKAFLVTRKWSKSA